MDEEMGLEGSKEETDAAVLIQNKFKALKLRKKSANETGETLILIIPLFEEAVPIRSMLQPNRFEVSLELYLYKARVTLLKFD